MYKKKLTKIEIADYDLFLFLVGLLRRVEEKRPEYLEVVEVNENNQTILFLSNSYFDARYHAF
jgi:hypothetical protein